MHCSKHCPSLIQLAKLFGLPAKKSHRPACRPADGVSAFGRSSSLSGHVPVLGRKFNKRPSADGNEMCDSLPLRAPHHIKTEARPECYVGILSRLSQPSTQFAPHVSNPRLASGFCNKCSNLSTCDLGQDGHLRKLWSAGENMPISLSHRGSEDNARGC
jgi:hypothetical protein